MARFTLGLAACLLAAAPSHAEDRGPIANASMAQELRLPTGTMRYEAAWRSVVLKDASGVPQATITMLSYVRTDVADRTKRPVVFAFNGGPGAASAALAYGFLGPKLRGAPTPGTSPFSPGGTMVDNPDTLLTVADLVMIDPVGTGFSRELRPGGGKPYWGLNGDAKATQAAIRDWLAASGRSRSPIYVLGESYGGFRAAAISKDLTDLDVAGIVFVSPGIDLSRPNDMETVGEFPAFALAAAAQGAVPAGGRSPEQIYEEARAFAQDDLDPALQAGVRLPQGRRDELAARMSAFTGIPAASYSAASLRLDSQSFLEQLRPGMIVGRIDTRVVAPVPKQQAVPGRDKAADDPALAMGASNVKLSPTVAAYLRGLGVSTDLDYVSLTLDVNFKWDWSWRSATGRTEDNLRVNAAPSLALFMKAKPAARVLLMGGYYDLAIPWLSQQYDLTHAGVAADRLTMVGYPSGHTIYSDETTRKAAMARLKAFVGGAK